jgi:hypothetical protein
LCKERGAIVLAETLDYREAAIQLQVDESDLRAEILKLETQLCLHISIDRAGMTQLTDDGRLFYNKLLGPLSAIWCERVQ